MKGSKVALNLLAQVIKRIKAPFFAQALGEVQRDGLVVQVAAEVGDVHLNSLMRVADGGVRSNIH